MQEPDLDVRVFGIIVKKSSQNRFRLIHKQLEELGIGQGGSSKFLAGASDHCREARRE